MESELPTCEFGYGKYLMVPFWYASAAYQARLVLPWVFWLDCVSLKYETMARPNSPDMPPKRTKKVRLGITTAHLRCSSLISNYIQTYWQNVQPFIFRIQSDLLALHLTGFPAKWKKKAAVDWLLEIGMELFKESWKIIFRQA